MTDEMYLIMQRTRAVSPETDFQWPWHVHSGSVWYNDLEGAKKYAAKLNQRYPEDEYKVFKLSEEFE